MDGLHKIHLTGALAKLSYALMIGWFEGPPRAVMHYRVRGFYAVGRLSRHPSLV